MTRQARPLIIITTKPRYLPGDAGNIGLFKHTQVNNCKSQEELLGIFDNQSGLCQLKSSLIFGHHCIDQARFKAQKDRKLRERFIPALTKCVDACLSTEEKKSITEIIYILHKDDLGSDERFKIIEKPQLLEHLSNLQIFDQRQLVEYKTGESQPNNLPVRFVAFSHQSDTHAFMDNFLYDCKQEASEIGVNIKELVDRSVEIPEKEWLLNKSFEQETLPASLSKFSFNIHDYDFTTRTFAPYKREEWKNLSNRLISLSSSTGNPINVVFTSLKFIEATEDLNFYKALISHFFSVETNNGSPTSLCPVLFIGYKDIIRKPPKNRKISGQKGQEIHLDPRYRFLDSSIWYRYVAVEEDFWGNLEEALHTFNWAYQHQLYKKNVCLEYLDLYNRLALNSYLGKFGDGKGHADQVYPFTFHSESFMERKAASLVQQFKQNNLNWNFLLVDDYANYILKEGQQNVIEDKLRSKGAIIKALIDHVPGLPEPANPKQADTGQPPEEKSFLHEFVQTPSVSEAIDVIQSRSPKLVFDIILLDYLFSLPEPTVSKGVELLEQIEAGAAPSGKGVSQKYWIHPITVFPEAMLSEFQEKSLQHFENHWFLARGADPINTPHLFRCSLYEFMNVQYDRLMVDEKRLWEFLGSVSILEAEGSHKVSKSNAFSAFSQLIEQFSAIEGAPPGSAVRNSVYNLLKGKHRDGIELLDHLRQLLYLFAYTTGFDAETIQAEYEKINALFKKYVEAGKDQREKSQPDETTQDGKEHEKIIGAAESSMQKLAIGVYSIAEKYF